MMQQAGAVAVAIFIATAIYYSGRISARLDHTEKRVDRIEDVLNRIFEQLRQLELLIRRGAQ